MMSSERLKNVRVVLEMLKKKWLILIFALFFLSVVMRMNVKETSFDLSPLYNNRDTNDPSQLSLDIVEFETKDFSSIFDNAEPLTIDMQGYKFGSYEKDFPDDRTTLSSSNIAKLKNDYGSYLQITNDFALANFQFSCSYQSYLYIHETAGGKQFYCHTDVIKKIMMNGASCLHFDVFDGNIKQEADQSFNNAPEGPVVYYGTKSKQISKNSISLDRCFNIIKATMESNDYAKFRDDPLFIALTLKTSTPSTLRQIAELWNSYFGNYKLGVGVDGSSDPISYRPIWEFKGKVLLMSSPIGDQLGIHNSQIKSENKDINSYNSLVNHYWGVPPLENDKNINMGDHHFSSQNIYNVQHLSPEIRKNYLNYVSHSLSFVFPCNTSGNNCEVANVYTDNTGVPLVRDDEVKRQTALKVMANSAPENSCNLKFERVWSTGAQFIFMYYQRPTDNPFLEYIENFFETKKNIIYKFNFKGGLGDSNSDDNEKGKYRFTRIHTSISCPQGQSYNQETGACVGGGGKSWISNDWQSRIQQTTNLIKKLNPH